MQLTIVWLTDEPLLESLNINIFDDLDLRARDLSNDNRVIIYLVVHKLHIKITSDNFATLATLPAPVFLDVGVMNEGDNGEEDNNSSSGDGTDIDVAQVMDLSTMNVTMSQSGSRWSEDEKEYLQNYSKFLWKKKEVKPDYKNFQMWLDARKTTQEHLFGGRAITAIFAQYRKMEVSGAFHEIQVKERKVRKTRKLK